jgi:hypothetical protein
MVLSFSSIESITWPSTLTELTWSVAPEMLSEVEYHVELFEEFLSDTCIVVFSNLSIFSIT